MLINKHFLFCFILYSFLSFITCQDAATEPFDPKKDNYDFKTVITKDTQNGFTIEYRNYYKIVTNTIASKTYCLVGFNQSIPEECQSYTSISIPVRDISIVEDSYAVTPYLELLDLLGSIIKTNTANVTSPCLNNSGLDTSTAVPDMVFSQQDALSGANYIRFSGNDDGLTPLKKASWLMYVAAFFDLELKAYSIYNQISTNYNCHRDNVLSTYSTVPVAWTDYDASASFYTVHSDTYYSQLVQDASGRLVATNAAQTDIFNPKNTNERLGLAIALRGAEVIVDMSRPSSVSYKQWIGGNPDYFDNNSSSTSQIQAIPAIINGRVYSVHRLLKNGNSDWFQRSHARPDLALLDLIHLIHPEYTIETTQNFPLWIMPFNDDSKVITVNEDVYGGCSSHDMEYKAFDQSQCIFGGNAINRTMMRKTSSSLSNGDKAGISVGTIVFGLLCVGVGIWLFRRYRRRQKRHQFYRMHEFQ